MESEILAAKVAQKLESVTLNSPLFFIKDEDF
jgi:hypothetical protein